MSLPDPPYRPYVDDVLGVRFNRTYGTGVDNFGPVTDHRIRYTRAQYLHMVSRWLNETAQSPSTWDGPLSVTTNLKFVGFPTVDATGDIDQTTTSTNGGPETNLSFSSNTQDVFFDQKAPEEDCSNCPLDPDTEACQNSRITEDLICGVTVSMSLQGAYCEQDGWDTATHFWLTFSITVSASDFVYYLCDDDSITPYFLSPHDPPTNYVGIGDSGGAGIIPTYTDEIPLGDGATSIFLDNTDAGSGTLFSITAFATTNGL